MYIQPCSVPTRKVPLCFFLSPSSPEVVGPELFSGLVAYKGCCETGIGWNSMALAWSSCKRGSDPNFRFF